jgi:plasmid stabilization system protein ParE
MQRISRLPTGACGVFPIAAHLARLSDAILLPYIVIYESREGTATVLRVMHGKRNITRDVIR